MYEYDKVDLVRRCGKFRMLDRLLVKLHAGGHRVLLFSTMTKLLDLLEEYLRWREVRPGETMGYLRIDGATSLEDRSAFPSGWPPGCQPVLSSRAAPYCAVDPPLQMPRSSVSQKRILSQVVALRVQICCQLPDRYGQLCGADWCWSSAGVQSLQMLGL